MLYYLSLSFRSIPRYNWSDPILQTYLSIGNAGEMDAMLKTLAHQRNTTFLMCFMNQHEIPCAEIIDEVKTDAGELIQ